MQHKMEIRFANGAVMSGDGEAGDREGLAQLGRLLISVAEGDNDAEMDIEGSTVQRVGDITSIRIEASR